MRILVDTCVAASAVRGLRSAGHEVVWVGEWDKDPGDAEILKIGLAQNRVIVTLDKDFGELAIVRDLPHSGIVRLVGWRAEEQGHAVQVALSRYGEELAAGALVTVTRTRIRVRPRTPR